MGTDIFFCSQKFQHNSNRYPQYMILGRTDGDLAKKKSSQNLIYRIKRLNVHGDVYMMV